MSSRVLLIGGPMAGKIVWFKGETMVVPQGGAYTLAVRQTWRGVAAWFANWQPLFTDDEVDMFDARDENRSRRDEESRADWEARGNETESEMDAHRGDPE